MSWSRASGWLLLAALGSCMPGTFRTDVGALFAEADGKVALQNAAGNLALGNEMNELGRDLDAGDVEASPYVRVQWDSERHRVRVHGFGIETDGTGTLAGDFGGLPAGTAVSTSMEFLTASAAYAYDVWTAEHARLGLGGQLGFYSIDVAASAPIGREQVDTDLLVPMPFAELETFVGPVSFAANAGIIAGRFRDANGRYLDLEALARWQVTGEIDLIAGYRFLLLDAHGTATSRDFDADFDVQGWFVGGGVRF